MTALLDLPGADAAKSVSPARRWIALGAMATAQLIVVLDALVMLIALPAMQRDIGLAEADGQWVMTAYALAIAGLLLLGGRLADFIGRKKAFLIGLAGFTAASALGGAAQDPTMLLTARVLQGATAALLMPAALALLSVTFTAAKERATALGVWSSVGASGMSIGLILGGLLTEYLSWRWCLLINVPIGAIAFFVGLATMVESRVPGRPRLDLGGTVSASLGMFLLVYGLSRAGTDGWGDSVTVGSLVSSVVLLTAFLVIEARVPDPLMPLRILADRNRLGAYIATACMMAGLMGTWLFVIYFLQGVRGYSAVECGLALLPYSVLLVAAAALLNQRVARAHPGIVIAIGWGFAAAGLLVMSFADVDWTVWHIVACTAPLGVGVITAFIAASGAILADAPEADAGTISAVFNVFQQVGTALGPAILTTVAVRWTEHRSGGGTPTPDNLTDGYGAAIAAGAVFLITAAVVGLVMVRRAPAPAPTDAGVPAARPRGLGVGGIVSGAGGAPLAGVAMTLVDWSGQEVARTNSDETGRYHLEVPDEGEFLMVVTPQDHRPTATLVSGGHSHDLVLDPAARQEKSGPVRPPSNLHPVTGSVRSADTGLGIPGAMVTLTSADGTPIAGTDTALDGTFRFDAVPAGTYQITTTVYREVTDTVEVPTGAEPAIITLDRGLFGHGPRR